MNNIATVDPFILDPKNELYNQLSSNPPEWWNTLKQDSDLYIEVRKKNVVEVYYQGGTLAKLVFDKKTKQITPIAHPKYLGHKDNGDLHYYKNDNKHTPIYQDCSKWLTNGIEKMKENIEDNYTEKHKHIEEISEKKIQGQLIVNNRENYLDSEFQHRLYAGERKQIRIDLVRIENNQIVFEELKKINDSRLHTTKADGPEILQQMNEYDVFITQNQSSLLEYYKKLIKIKEKLGLPLPVINDINTLIINPNPVLIIANNYDDKKGNKQRETRRSQIEQTLLDKAINYRFFDI